MASRTLDMTKGSPAGLIIRFALPMMAGNVFQQLYTVVDTMVVGKALGVGALAALGACDWLYWLIISMVHGLTQGFAVLMAQAFGAREQDKLRHVVGLSAVLCAVSTVILLFLGQCFMKPVLVLLQTPDEILGNAVLYLRIMCAGLPILMAYNLLACILRSLGDSKTPLYAMITACFVNIGLDLLFVLAFRWGIAGAAAASLTAQASSALICLLRLGKMEELKLRREDFRRDWPMIGNLLRLGATMAFQFMIIAVGGLAVQFVVNGFGVVFIAGFTATNKLYGILEIAATSFGFAIVTYVGQNLGAGRIDRIRLGQRSAYLLAVATSLVIAAVMLIFGKPILGSFLSGTPEEFESALNIAYRYLRVMSLGLPLLYILYVVRSSLQGLGNASYPFASGVAELIVRVAVAWILPGLVGQEGIFFAEVLAWVGADVVLLIGWFVTLRKQK